MNENHIGNRIRQELNQGLKLEPAVLESLHAGRQRALARQPQSRTAPIAAFADNVLGRAGLSAVPQLVLPVLLLVAGFFAFNAWQQTQNIREIEEIDAAVLTDDLPIDAYLDKGFDVWLKHSAQ